MTTVSEVRTRFHDLHRSGCFIIPNPWDIGSARMLEALGFDALATTSSGFAASLGRRDQHTTLDELATHVAAICAAVDIPVSVDAEWCFADEPEGVAATVDRLASAGAAGLSIEDHDPAAGVVVARDVAATRVEAAAAAAHHHGMVLTARAENHLYRAGDLDDTIDRLIVYRDAGADVLYAPGLTAIDDIRRVTDAVAAPVNVLALPSAPAVPELAEAGVRRVSIGGSLAAAAYGALVNGAQELLTHGTSTYAARRFDHSPFSLL